MKKELPRKKQSLFLQGDKQNRRAYYLNSYGFTGLYFL
jgi:hypothetical protein